MIASYLGEAGFEPIDVVLAEESCAIPSVVLLEFTLVTIGKGVPPTLSEHFLNRLMREQGIKLVDFGLVESQAARLAANL